MFVKAPIAKNDLLGQNSRKLHLHGVVETSIETPSAFACFTVFSNAFQPEILHSE